MTTVSGSSVSSRAENLAECLPQSHPMMSSRGLLIWLWQEIEQLPPLQRCAYLLNFTDGNLGLLTVCGIVSIRQIGRTLQLTADQFQRAWLLLEWREDQREQARSLTDYDEQFAMLWQQLPLNDLTLAALLGTSRENVIHLRLVARLRLRRQLVSQQFRH